MAAGRSTSVRFDDALRPITMPGKRLRISRKRPRTGDQLSAVHRFPLGGDAAGVGIRYEWWTVPSTKKAKAKLRKAGKSVRAKRVRGAGDMTWVPKSRYRGHKVKVRVVADSPVHRRTVFSSAWSSALR